MSTISDLTLALTIRTTNWTYYDYANKVSATIEITHDERMELKDSLTIYDIPLVANNLSTGLQSFDVQYLNFALIVYQRMFDLEDEPKPLNVSVQVSFKLNACSSREILNCPMLSPILQNKILKVQQSVDFYVGCEDPDNCNCNLKLNTTKSTYHVIVGKDRLLDLELHVTNEGPEPAFGAEISIESPIIFQKIKGPRGKCPNRKCILRKVKKNSRSDVFIRFILPEDFGDLKSFNLQPTLNDKCRDSRDQTLPELKICLKYETQITSFVELSSSQAM